MIRIVLRIVVLENKSWSLDPVIVTLSGSNLARPREVNIFKTGVFDSLAVHFSEIAAKLSKIDLDQFPEHLLLCFVHFRRRNTSRR